MVTFTLAQKYLHDYYEKWKWHFIHFQRAKNWSNMTDLVWKGLAGFLIRCETGFAQFRLSSPCLASEKEIETNSQQKVSSVNSSVAKALTVTFHSYFLFWIVVYFTSKQVLQMPFTNRKSSFSPFKWVFPSFSVTKEGKRRESAKNKENIHIFPRSQPVFECQPAFKSNT